MRQNVVTFFANANEKNLAYRNPYYNDHNLFL